jgi:hypothetical protein
MAFLSSISTTSITLDGNTLDTGGGGFGATLLLNGVAIATTSNISSLTDWAYFPAISTIDCDQEDIVDCKDIFATNLTLTNALTAVVGGITTVNSTTINNTGNLTTNTLQTTGLINAASISTPSLRANLISTGTINFSTLLGANATIGGISTNTISSGTIQTGSITANTGNYSTIAVSTITAGSVVFPVAPNLVVSSITVGGATTTNTLSVTGGATFAGTRPNFTTGINTTAANNFNNTTLDNVGPITANTVLIGSSNYVNINTSSFTTVTNDRGADVGGSSVINLISKFGQSTRVNITADASSALSPTPTQIITLTANGATSLTQNGIGGRVSLVANAGSGTGCNILAYGQIDLTAFSSAPFPGLIKESAGSILAYSGLTVPGVGLPGCSFYSALTCLSLTAGATPATTSFPGVVLLRGDNGTKVENGFFSDTITATSNSVLPTITTNGLTAFTGSSLAFFATSQNIQFNSATVGFNANIAGPLSVSTITNVSTINGSPYVPGGGGGGGWVSTATSALNMNGNGIGDNTGFLTISSIDVFVGGVDIATIAAGNNSTNTVAAFTSSSIDLLQFGGAGFIRRNAAGNIIDTAVGNIQTQAVSTINTVPHTVFTGSVRVSSISGISSINGSAYPPISTWVSTATSPLNMNGNGIGDGSGFLTISSITVGVVGSDSVGLYAGNNSTFSVLNLTSTNIDLIASTVTRSLGGVSVAQPVIQYGEDGVSGASGSVAITLGTPYTSVSSFVAFACMMDTTPAQVAVNRDSDSQITLGWSSAGGGSHRIA